MWPGGPHGNETGFSYFFSRQDDVEYHLTKTNHDVMRGDLIHTPDEGAGVSMFLVRQQALYTLSAIASAAMAMAMLCRIL